MSSFQKETSQFIASQASEKKGAPRRETYPQRSEDLPAHVGRDEWIAWREEQQKEGQQTFELLFSDQGKKLLELQYQLFEQSLHYFAHADYDSTKKSEEEKILMIVEALQLASKEYVYSSLSSEQMKRYLDAVGESLKKVRFNELKKEKRILYREEIFQLIEKLPHNSERLLRYLMQAQGIGLHLRLAAIQHTWRALGFASSF